MVKARIMPIREGTAQVKFNRSSANYLEKKKNSILVLPLEYTEMSYQFPRSGSALRHRQSFADCWVKPQLSLKTGICSIYLGCSHLVNHSFLGSNIFCPLWPWFGISLSGRKWIVAFSIRLSNQLFVPGIQTLLSTALSNLQMVSITPTSAQTKPAGIWKRYRYLLFSVNFLYTLVCMSWMSHTKCRNLLLNGQTLYKLV